MSLFGHFHCFPQHFFELGVNFVENVAHRSVGPKKPYRAGPGMLAYGGTLRRP